MIDSPLPDPTTEQVRFIPAVPDGWQFILDYPRPPKGLHANDRTTGWFERAGAVADMRREVMAKTRALKIGARDKIRVEITWVVKDKRKRDTDGPDPMCKAIYDGIGSSRGVSARVVEDDSPEFMDKPRLVIRYEKGVRPHFEVKITEID